MSSLGEKVAVITGASRGIGKGIALALAGQGATVYVTGRTVSPDSHALPGTVAETAEACNTRGGKGIAVPVDHAVDEQVAALFDRVRQDEGRLDILVNNAFALPDDLTLPLGFWKKPLSNLDMFEVGVRSNFVAAWHAAQIMVPRKTGLIIAISGYTGVSYTYGVIFGTSKSATDRMARDMAVELEPHGVCSISLWQGLTMTERAERVLADRPGLKEGAATQVGDSSSVEHPGRLIAALATDPDVMRHSGGTFITAELARTYGVVDVDGRCIPTLRDKRGSPIWAPIRSDPFPADVRS